MRNYLYRRRPAAVHYSYERTDNNPILEASFLPQNDDLHTIPSQVSWTAFQIPDKSSAKVDFTQGLHTLGGSGRPKLREVTIVEEHSPNGARGYVVETWGTKWELAELGPLGGYGLANSRDFLFPTADIDTTSTGDWKVVTKQLDRYYVAHQRQTPFEVVAWHGNYIPYKYDMTKFVAQNSVSVDHTDPSINTVLTAKSRDDQTPLADFLVFGPRWDVS
ncbi:hypothetical protein LTR10_021352 [Elasticomyces elasticus]|uniref:homogentisate 1,2-dioxygenase n=1 Tax=Exophiala sideris TaxID=1016849 RepID=A0ABR0JEV9_9EURO|nr:hypothetical protein LTR10_021352 [Elasticomyces elasticus]KAK5032915.1 hypothetical protein LTS07_004326 [Exophiala sideris]KAK5062439.1 hypothetical protein LTR69_004798 [Exophiala sideris]KAK5177597.1 hypothetical protein LTR44_010008 [Eurotiomycetes sp. CCFEE 6388]